MAESAQAGGYTLVGMSTVGAVSVEEYLTTVYEPDCEYSDGEIVTRNVGEPQHSALQMIIAALLYEGRKNFRIHVFPELRVQLSPTHFRVPDICVTARPARGRTLREPPLLCVEILSPDDRMSRVEARIEAFLRFGVLAVWLIDPENRRAWTYTRDGRIEAAEMLEFPPAGIAIRVQDIFRALDEDVERQD